MNKIKVNNEIILLRKDVDRARVLVINKLNKNILQLRNKKGNEDQKAKNQEKAKRYANEILSIKKAKKDEITKFALTNKLPLIEILGNKNSDSLTRIMARIADHKKFRDKISVFKTKYPDYEEFLGPGRKKKQKLEKKEKNKLKNGSKTENDDSKKPVERTSNNEKSNSNDIDQSESDSEHSTSVSENGSSFENLNHNKNEEDSRSYSSKDNEGTRESKDVGTILTKSLSNDVSENDSEENMCMDSVNSKLKSNESSKISKKNSPMKNCETTQMRSKKQSLGKRKSINTDQDFSSKLKCIKKPILNQQCSNKEGIIKKFSDILNGGDENISDKKEINESLLEQDETVEKDVDPFFLSEDGRSNYLSAAIVQSKRNNNINNDDDHNSEDDYSRHNSQKYSQKNSKSFSNGVKPRRDDFKKYNKPDSRWGNQHEDGNSFKKHKLNNKAFEKPNKNFKAKSKLDKKESSSNQSNEVLHPSWEAKRKQQEMIKQGFQGKKIVFGDDV